MEMQQLRYVVDGTLNDDEALINYAKPRAAELSKLNRESLYRLFSRDGNPRLSSLNSVLSALGLKVTFEPAA